MKKDEDDECYDEEDKMIVPVISKVTHVLWLQKKKIRSKKPKMKMKVMIRDSHIAIKKFQRMTKWILERSRVFLWECAPIF